MVYSSVTPVFTPCLPRCSVAVTYLAVPVAAPRVAAFTCALVDVGCARTRSRTPLPRFCGLRTRTRLRLGSGLRCWFTVTFVGYVYVALVRILHVTHAFTHVCGCSCLVPLPLPLLRLHVLLPRLLLVYAHCGWLRTHTRFALRLHTVAFCRTRYTHGPARTHTHALALQLRLVLRLYAFYARGYLADSVCTFGCTVAVLLLVCSCVARTRFTLVAFGWFGWLLVTFGYTHAHAHVTFGRLRFAVAVQFYFLHTHFYVWLRYTHTFAHTLRFGYVWLRYVRLVFPVRYTRRSGFYTVWLRSLRSRAHFILSFIVYFAFSFLQFCWFVRSFVRCSTFVLFVRLLLLLFCILRYFCTRYSCTRLVVAGYFTLRYVYTPLHTHTHAFCSFTFTFLRYLLRLPRLVYVTFGYVTILRCYGYGYTPFDPFGYIYVPHLFLPHSFDFTRLIFTHGVWLFGSVWLVTRLVTFTTLLQFVFSFTRFTRFTHALLLLFCLVILRFYPFYGSGLRLHTLRCRTPLPFYLCLWLPVTRCVTRLFAVTHVYTHFTVYFTFLRFLRLPFVELRFTLRCGWLPHLAAFTPFTRFTHTFYTFSWFVRLLHTFTRLRLVGYGYARFTVVAFAFTFTLLRVAVCYPRFPSSTCARFRSPVTVPPHF